jgi:hypothetical protein
MSFLDNLENSLKALEGREEGEDLHQKHLRREAEAKRARAAAPHAERLRSAPYTQELLKQATRAGHALRAKVNLAWIDSTLRLQARDRKLELRPTPDGVVAIFTADDREICSRPVDLEGDPAALVREWLGDLLP